MKCLACGGRGKGFFYVPYEGRQTCCRCQGSGLEPSAPKHEPEKPALWPEGETPSRKTKRAPYNPWAGILSPTEQAEAS